MNIQTERLENHTARLTVELEPAAFEQAKQKAARKLSNRVNLPGFRKGKAPYHIVVRYIGEPAIVEEAVEMMSSNLYPLAIQESGLDPYGPGSVEDIQADPLAIVYSVPLAPTADLKGYRDIRQPYTPPDVTDRDVERGLKRLQEREADIEPTDEPAELGNRVTLDIHSHLHEAGHEGHEHEGDEGDEGHDGHEGQGFIHEHDFEFVLDENDDLLPGFSASLVGAKAGDNREFELTIPEDSVDYAADRGKTAHFEVVVNEVAHITLPELNDDFAELIISDDDEDFDDDDLDDEVLAEAEIEMLENAAAAAEEPEEAASAAETEEPVSTVEAEADSEDAGDDDYVPATMAQLRLKVRADLERASTEEVKERYAAQMLEAIVEQSDVHYPEAMVADQVENMLERMDQQLRQQGMNLDDYKRLLHKSDEDLFNDYRDSAADIIRRSMVRREFFRLEQLATTDADMDAEFDRIAGESMSAEQRAAIRGLFESQGMADYLREQLAERMVRDRLFAIGTGDAPDLPAPAVPESVETTESEEETT